MEIEYKLILSKKGYVGDKLFDKFIEDAIKCDNRRSIDKGLIKGYLIQEFKLIDLNDINSSDLEFFLPIKEQHRHYEFKFFSDIELDLEKENVGGITHGHNIYKTNNDEKIETYLVNIIIPNSLIQWFKLVTIDTIIEPLKIVLDGRALVATPNLINRVAYRDVDTCDLELVLDYRSPNQSARQKVNNVKIPAAVRTLNKILESPEYNRKKISGKKSKKKSKKRRGR